jgi:wobble nucleotide-excising tRNase
MLKRISEIKNIGRFKSPSGLGSIEFGKMTVIFGRNTYGKSTLVDIFSSIVSNNLTSIITRQSIPYDNSGQSAKLSFLLDSIGSQQPVNFNGSNWQPTLPQPLRLCVFDDSFYHNNIFAARQFTRDTKSGFSSFALGAQGVAKANEISEKKQLKGKLTRERTKLEKDAFLTVNNLSAFLRLTPANSIDESNILIDELRKKWSDLNKQLKNADAIVARNQCNVLDWEKNLDDSLQRLNTALQTSLQTFHKEAQQKVSQHIQQHFKNINNAESWIRQGLEQNLGETCQFCGQSLAPEALQLLELYQQNFDDSFNQHEAGIKRELENCRLQLIDKDTNKLKFIIERNKTALASYHELETDNDFLALNSKSFYLAEQLEKQFIIFTQQNLEAKSLLSTIISKKIELPHIAVETVNLDSYLQTEMEIKNFIQEYNAVIFGLNILLEKFKNSVKDNSLIRRIEDIKAQGELEKNRIKRLELSEQCHRYIDLGLELDNLTIEIPRLQSELEQEQSDFLNKFFSKINQFFRDFGSHDFTLEKAINTLGNTPIYYLKVKFNGKAIKEADLEYIFSESDRRALALSVFWASLSGIDKNEKQNTIVILDDPVTSFDSNRMTTVHQKIKELSASMRQVIMLSHYEQDVAGFLKVYRNIFPITFISIERESGTSTLKKADIENFIRNEHEKTRENILGFISGVINVHSQSDLRIFLESELEYRFAKQIKDFSINEHNLSDRIDKLNEKEIITNAIAQKLHGFREVLNPRHHIWISSDIEDKRNTARQFMEFIYQELIPIVNDN